MKPDLKLNVRRRDLLKGVGGLLIAWTMPPGAMAMVATDGDPPLDQVDSFLAIAADGSVTACSGQVDLGTGIRTALAQIVAEELDVPFNRVTMLLGDTGRVPDQGRTIASRTIQTAAVPLRRAAAQARQFLVERAAAHLGVPISALVVKNGVIQEADDSGKQVSYAALIGGQRFALALSTAAKVKNAADYKLVGTSVARVDIPTKATGGLIYVHDMRIDGMLHGRVVRPPCTGVDNGVLIGHSLLSVDEASVGHIPGVVRVVVIKDFVGVVAQREEHAVAAARALKVQWKPYTELPDLANLEPTLRAHPSKPRVLKTAGDVDTALRSASKALSTTYIWPYQMHGSIGPSCALADVRGDAAVVWSGTQNPYELRADLAKLLGLAAGKVRIVRMEAAGCYGRNCADDVAADAVLLSREVGRPVRMQLMRDQEHGWEPKGAAQLIDVHGGVDANGRLIGYDFATCYPSNAAPTLALLLTGAIDATPALLDMGDRSAVPPYSSGALRVVVNDMAPIVRASWLRGVSGLPNVFARESFMDELAADVQIDPLEFRLRHLAEERGRAVLIAAAERAGWQTRPSPNPHIGTGDVVTGRGLAYSRYIHSKFPGIGAAWAAWVADVEVNKTTGDVHAKKIVVAHDCGLMVNPDGVRHQIHGNVIQTISRTLKEAVSFDRSSVSSLDWGSYPIVRFPEVPEIDVVMLSRPDQPPLGVGEAASVPGPAAIANAIFDATGIRLRLAPFTPDRLIAELK
jgi:nicotinate dehydrogenase subunit B